MQILKPHLNCPSSALNAAAASMLQCCSVMGSASSARLVANVQQVA